MTKKNGEGGIKKREERSCLIKSYKEAHNP